VVQGAAAALALWGGACLAQAPAAAPGVSSAAAVPVRPATWAQPIKRQGLPNLFKVSDRLYRGAQPTDVGLQGLQELGVKTVVDLRAGHSDNAQLPAGLRLVSIPMRAWRAKEADMVRFLRVATDRQSGPVFVHCAHGSDRTGLMVAVYRIAVQGWSKDEAIREMTSGGYGFNSLWKNLPAALRKLDVEKLKAEAGLDGTR
jgi:protein tyrosine/serine phosphatase